jgi:uncharacterized protein
MKKLFFAALCGLLFAAGLVLSGMTQPAKVLVFLNVLGMSRGISWTAQSGLWDPSLALVMGGALCVTLLAFAITPPAANRPGKQPWAALKFDLPERRDVDAPLVIGAALFGVGWGLVGYCLGPAFAALLTGGWDAALFTAALLVGMAVAKRFSR